MLIVCSADDRRCDGDVDMKRIVLVRDKDEQRRLWDENWPRESIFDEWAVRDCFATAYNNESIFVLRSENNNVCGLLPLGRMEDSNCYGFYPGETWSGATWLECNRIMAASTSDVAALLESAPADLDLRYIRDCSNLPILEVDEINYSYYPEQSGGYSGYWRQLHTKKARQLSRDLSIFNTCGVKFCWNRLADIQVMIDFNNINYSTSSYFFDIRFARSFEALARWLFDNNALRITTILVGGVVAAVDFGVVWRDCYTLLTGGASREFPGIAKLINMHHIEWGCANAMKQIDFLCGDFGWKKHFGLQPLPYYRLRRTATEVQS